MRFRRGAGATCCAPYFRRRASVAPRVCGRAFGARCIAVARKHQSVGRRAGSSTGVRSLRWPCATLASCGH
eukprot:3248767-Alexandrium_andersonii.AAC.1